MQVPRRTVTGHPVLQPLDADRYLWLEGQLGKGPYTLYAEFNGKVVEFNNVALQAIPEAFLEMETVPHDLMEQAPLMASELITLDGRVSTTSIAAHTGIPHDMILHVVMVNRKVLSGFVNLAPQLNVAEGQLPKAVYLDEAGAICLLGYLESNDVTERFKKFMAAEFKRTREQSIMDPPPALDPTIFEAQVVTEYDDLSGPSQPSQPTASMNVWQPPVLEGEIVTLHDGVPVTTTLAIAQFTKSEHHTVILLVRKYLVRLQELGLVEFEIRPRSPGQHGGGDAEYALLNEDQANLLMMCMRNSDIVFEFKLRLVKAFAAFRRAAEALPPAANLSPAEQATETLQQMLLLAQAQVASEKTAKAALDLARKTSTESSALTTRQHMLERKQEFVARDLEKALMGVEEFKDFPQRMMQTLEHVSEPTAPLQPLTRRAELVSILRTFAAATSLGSDAVRHNTHVWNVLYHEFYMRNRMDLPQRAANFNSDHPDLPRSKHKRAIDIAEELGMIEDLYTLAVYLFVDKSGTVRTSWKKPCL